MTSNERKIINCLWETKEKTHIRLVAQKANFSSDYARLLCRSLARAGHIKFENDLAHLLKKGRSRFSAEGGSASGGENNSVEVAYQPMAVAANVTLLTDEPVAVSSASDRSDEEENQEEGAGEDKDKDKPVSSDEELDKALAGLESPSKKEEGEKIDKPEESEKTESVEEAERKEEQREEEILAKPAIKIEEEETESPGATTESKEEATEKEEITELEPQVTAESTEAKEEVKADVQETGATETEPVDNPVLAAPLESSEETAAMKKEEKQEKEDAVKPSSGSGWSFKKIVNWFTEKK